MIRPYAPPIPGTRQATPPAHADAPAEATAPGVAAGTIVAGPIVAGLGLRPQATEEAILALLAAIEDPEALAVATAERALLAALDGSCRTPIGGHARLLPDGGLRLTGLVARPDGSFLLRRVAEGRAADAAAIGRSLGAALRRDSPIDLFG